MVSSASVLHAADATQPFVITLNRADFVIGEDSRPPNDAAAWQAVSLPHEWRRTHPGREGIGWYRFRVDLPQAPAGAQAIRFDRWRFFDFDIFVNERLIAGAHEVTEGIGGGIGFGIPGYFTVPPSLLRAGENTIHVRMSASSGPAELHGLDPLEFGDARTLRRRYISASEQGPQVERASVAFALTAGLISLFLWIARRNDRVMLWFSIACLSWCIPGVLMRGLRWWDLPPLDSVLNTYLRYGLVVPAVILCLRIVGLRHARFEVILGLFLMTEVSYPLWLGGANGAVILGLDIANTALVLTGAAVILYGAQRPLRWSDWIETAALVAMAVLMFHEVTRYLGWIDVDSPVLRHFHVYIMLAVFGATIFHRHVMTSWRTERVKADLELRVGEKLREIEANHVRIEEAKREQALALERQRILADMHDGLGASLIGLLRHVQSGGSDRGSIERRVQQALREMRIAIDVMQPRGGDVAVVLGSLRHQLDDMVRATGVSLVWEVEGLPALEGLPSTVFALQRILLEVIANALKHSGARRLRFTAAALGETDVEIRIEDDGCGFDPSQPATGMGLINMRARAQRIGARLNILSLPGEGTRVQISIPFAQARFAEEDVTAGPQQIALQERVLASGIAN